MRSLRLAFGVAVAAVTVLLPASAYACGGASLFFPSEVQPLRLRVANIDQFPADPTYVLEEPPREIAVFLAHQHTLAMAAARSGGESGPWAAPGDNEKLQNLVWAAIITQFHAAVRPDDPLLWANAAEAAAAVPTLEPVAYDILTDLHERDLVPHARSYALLAELQRERGELVSSEQSLLSCRHLADDDDTCRTSGVPNA